MGTLQSTPGLVVNDCLLVRVEVTMRWKRTQLDPSTSLADAALEEPPQTGLELPTSLASVRTATPGSAETRRNAVHCSGVICVPQLTRFRLSHSFTDTTWGWSIRPTPTLRAFSRGFRSQVPRMKSSSTGASPTRSLALRRVVFQAHTRSAAAKQQQHQGLSVPKPLPHPEHAPTVGACTSIAWPTSRHRRDRCFATLRESPAPLPPSAWAGLWALPLWQTLEQVHAGASLHWQARLPTQRAHVSVCSSCRSAPSPPLRTLDAWRESPRSTRLNHTTSTVATPPSDHGHH